MDVSTFTAHRRYLATRDGEIAYTEFGDGPVALFVHGLGTNGVLWRHAIEQVSGTSRCIAIDLPAHGGTPARPDLSAGAMADVLEDLCDGLGLEQVDLVANDTGGAIAQIFAARHPHRLRTFVLTNCDTEGNFPPEEFTPILELARQGQVAPMLVALYNDPSSWRTSPLVGGYEDPTRIPDDALRSYFAPLGETIDHARDFERALALLDSADLTAAVPGLRTLEVPTLLVWGTGDAVFGIKWAYQLRDTIPGARDVIEVEGAKIFFPEERPNDLVPHLRSHWGR